MDQKNKASLMLHYAGEDERINNVIPAFEEALKKAGTDYQLFRQQYLYIFPLPKGHGSLRPTLHVGCRSSTG